MFGNAGWGGGLQTADRGSHIAVRTSDCLRLPIERRAWGDFAVCQIAAALSRRITASLSDIYPTTPSPRRSGRVVGDAELRFERDVQCHTPLGADPLRVRSSHFVVPSTWFASLSWNDNIIPE